jgi:NADH-quinone oxidoreductase subunit J
MIETIVFVVASLMVLGGAVGVVVRGHPVHAALSLVLTLFGVAVHFVALEAHFLAAVQVIVYAGAIVVLFLFVIMLLGVDATENLKIEPFRVQRPLALIVGVSLVTLIGAAIVASEDSLAERPQQSQAVLDALDDAGGDANVRALARNLFEDHLFAFELTSVLLVIAVVGTVLLARRPSRRRGLPATGGAE